MSGAWKFHCSFFAVDMLVIRLCPFFDSTCFSFMSCQTAHWPTKQQEDHEKILHWFPQIIAAFSSVIKAVRNFGSDRHT